MIISAILPAWLASILKTPTIPAFNARLAVLPAHLFNYVLHVIQHFIFQQTLLVFHFAKMLILLKISPVSLQIVKDKAASNALTTIKFVPLAQKDILVQLMEGVP